MREIVYTGLLLIISLQFIYTATFMAKSLSNHVSNLSERVRKIKCKYWHNYKNVKFAELNVNIAITFMTTQTLKMI